MYEHTIKMGNKNIMIIIAITKHINFNIKLNT